MTKRRFVPPRGYGRLVSIALLAVAGCGGGEDVTPRNLADARALWDSAGISDYDLEWTSSGARRGHYLVTVRAGEVRAVTSVLPDGREIAAKPGDASYYGMDGLFRILEEEASQLLEERPFGQAEGSRILLKFDPDPTLGYPRHYRRDVVGSPQALAIDVVRLEPLRSSRPKVDSRESADVGDTKSNIEP